MLPVYLNNVDGFSAPNTNALVNVSRTKFSKGNAGLYLVWVCPIKLVTLFNTSVAQCASSYVLLIALNNSSSSIFIISKSPLGL